MMIAIDAGRRARLPDRRRADHGARRDDPGADPRPAARPAARAAAWALLLITHDLGSRRAAWRTAWR
ncbi:MAG: hypothetical protein MZW92_72720 [Comamonadaceae bacterium]|nr:hypothetical protein [Comamonadaceae bacterium]